ncbi:unnamed protein product, partial [Closterium sp. NIES-54]
AAAAVAATTAATAPDHCHCPLSHQVVVSHRVAVSSQVLVSGPVAASCSWRSLAHPTVLWHHRFGHPPIPRLCAMSKFPGDFYADPVVHYNYGHSWSSCQLSSLRTRGLDHGDRPHLHDFGGGAIGALEGSPGATTAPDTTPPPHPYRTRHHARVRRAREEQLELEQEERELEWQQLELQQLEEWQQ